MNLGRRLNHTQCHQTIVGTNFFHRAAKMPKFCQNCGFCNRSKLPRSSPDAFVRLIVCVWFPTFCRINGNFSVTDWAEIERSQKSDGTQSFPTNIYKSKISHCTIESKLPIFTFLRTLIYMGHIDMDTLNQERALTTDRLLTNRICEVWVRMSSENVNFIF